MLMTNACLTPVLGAWVCRHCPLLPCVELMGLVRQLRKHADIHEGLVGPARALMCLETVDF
jgi:hypothetical protein